MEPLAVLQLSINELEDALRRSMFIQSEWCKAEEDQLGNIAEMTGRLTAIHYRQMCEGLRAGERESGAVLEEILQAALQTGIVFGLALAESKPVDVRLIQ